MTWSYAGFKHHTHFSYRYLLVPVMETRGSIPLSLWRIVLLKARLKGKTHLRFGKSLLSLVNLTFFVVTASGR